METLQFIGLATLVFLAYRYIYIPYINKKKGQTEEIENKIGILSGIQKDMRELFNPYANYVEQKEEDDEYAISYGSWIKLYGRRLHFTSDTEIQNFKKKAIELFNRLNSDELTKAQIERIFIEEEQRRNEDIKQKEIAYLALRKNFLEYDTLLKQILPDHNIILPKQDIIYHLAKSLNKSSGEIEIVFNNLSDKKTGLLSQEYNNGWQDKYYYFGELTVETKLKQL